MINIIQISNKFIYKQNVLVVDIIFYQEQLQSSIVYPEEGDEKCGDLLWTSNMLSVQTTEILCIEVYGLG